MTDVRPDAVRADPRYRQLCDRDAAADGQFVYAVRSTGIFCRPSCPSRTPRPENVAFFQTGTAARAAGYRACLRCRPDEAQPADPLAARMQAIAAFITDHADEDLPLTLLAPRAGLSPAHFQRRFKAIIGVSPRAFQAAERLKRMKTALRDGADVLDAGFGAGFGSTSRIYDRIEGGLGMTPSAYRAGGAGETIVHAVRDSALGPLMMAATGRGVCFVQFGDDADALHDQLRAEFPKARLQPAAAEAGPPLDAWMAALDAHLAQGAPSPDLPLDLRGTAFQLKVWQFLLSVKPGKVVSYAEIARGIGAPRATRAVGSACGANRIGVLIPCHRALRADGGLGGYRWGLERKRALLDAERRTAAAPDR